MIIDHVAVSPEGPAEPAARQWQVLERVGQAPQQFFRRELRFALNSGGMAEDLRIVADATVLQAAFRPYEYDVLAVDAASPLRAALTPSGDAVIVALDAPRQVVRVVIAAAKASGSALELFRLDGNVRAEKPSATGASNARLAPGGVRAPGGGRGFAVDFTDARFALRLKDAGGLAPADIREIWVRSYPATPRIGLAFPADPSANADPAAALFFWQAPGEIGRGTPEGAGVADAGPDLAGALDRALRRFIDQLRSAPDSPRPPLPASIPAVLVIASDAPCLLDLSAFGIAYRLARESFAGGAEKRVLRYDGALAVAQEIPLALPPGAGITAATLRTVESFRNDRSLSGAAGETPEPEPPEKTGVHLDDRRWVAQGIAPEKAVSLSGVVLGLMALAPGTRVTVELQEDHDGRPSGRTLAAGGIALAEAGRRAWATLRFPDPVVLPGQTHWLVLRAAGEAVWLTGAGGNAALPLRVRETSDPSPSSPFWTAPAAFDGLQALHRLLSRTAPANGVAASPPVTLRIGDAVVAGTPGQAGTNARTYDLTAALRSGPSPTAPLTFTAAVPGILTVYPPRVEYEIPL